MDREVIEQKLESLRRCIQRIETKCPADPAVLQQDTDLQDVITLNLTRAVQMCVDIGSHIIAGLEILPPTTMGKTFDALAEAGVIDEKLAVHLKKAVGFRNIAVHNYEAIDWIIVHAIARHHLNEFTEFAQAIATRLNNLTCQNDR